MAAVPSSPLLKRARQSPALTPLCGVRALFGYLNLFSEDKPVDDDIPGNHQQIEDGQLNTDKADQYLSVIFQPIWRFMEDERFGFAITPEAPHQ